MQTSQLVISVDGCAPAIMDLPAALALIPAEADLLEVIQRVMKFREAVPLVFTDGRAGTLARLDATADPIDGQTSLRLLDGPGQLPLRDFEVECKLFFEVAAMVTCQAPNKRAAAYVVGEVFKGRGSTVPLSVEIDREELSAIIGYLDKPSHTARDFERLSPQVVTINHIEARGDDTLCR